MKVSKVTHHRSMQNKNWVFPETKKEVNRSENHRRNRQRTRRNSRRCRRDRSIKRKRDGGVGGEGGSREYARLGRLAIVRGCRLCIDKRLLIRWRSSPGRSCSTPLLCFALLCFVLFCFVFCSQAE